MSPRAEDIIAGRMCGRAGREEIAASNRTVSLDPTLTTMLDAIVDYVVVLNDRRQIVAVNRQVLEGFDIPGVEEFLGLRPGEAFGCIHSDEGEDGCGTGIHCTTCGAVMSIVTAQNEQATSFGECRLILRRNEGTALDLAVVTAPIVVDGRTFFVCTLRDVSDLKRRNVLERVFFHDVINTAGGIHGLASLLIDGECLSGPEREEYQRYIHSLSGKLIDEIKYQRQLLAAERGDFVPRFEEFPASRVLGDVFFLLGKHEVAEGKTLRINGGDGIVLVSDEMIVRRILCNLVKNGLEAITPGETVTLSCNAVNGKVIFAVHNPTVMTDEVRLQIFKRSFSTKDSHGRGIGTYSVKLFGEKYLKGRVTFTSGHPAGTTFTFSLDQQPALQPQP